MTKAEELKERSRRFALDIVRLVRHFPRTLDSEIVARQLIKSATSVAANYRAACRSRSPGEFISKIGLVCEEADESCFWLDVAISAEITNDPDGSRLASESRELCAIFTASRNTAKRNHRYGGSVTAILAMLAILAILAMQ
jgi:four helix bundle protein